MKDFARTLPLSLLKARETVMKTFMPHLREHDFSPQQWRVLRVLFDQGQLEMSALSDRCILLMPSLSRIVRNLEKRELLCRRTAEKDQRRSIISLSAKGTALVEKLVPCIDDCYERIDRVFDEGKQESLFRLLDELVEKLELIEEKEQ